MLKDAIKLIESDELHLKQKYRKWRVQKSKYSGILKIEKYCPGLKVRSPASRLVVLDWILTLNPYDSTICMLRVLYQKKIFLSGTSRTVGNRYANFWVNPFPKNVFHMRTNHATQSGYGITDSEPKCLGLVWNILLSIFFGSFSNVALGFTWWTHATDDSSNDWFQDLNFRLFSINDFLKNLFIFVVDT